MIRLNWSMLPLARGGLAVNAPAARGLVWPRWLAWLWAKAFHYFWLPCKSCGKPFAGFEWGATFYRGPHAGSGTCADPECVAEVERVNGFKGSLVSHVMTMESQDDNGHRH